ncbi:MAG: MTH1187 family thiamine-binding protein [Candidatus Eisenbacteria bacterium]|nr:MTH1187 family thiamine-binding protein [Candidatus Eisenbacteria bacterium]
MAVCEISVVPVGTASASVSEFVVEAQHVIRKSGLKFQLGPMGTSCEGDVEDLLRVAKEVHEACFKMGAKRVLTSIKIDDRRDKHLSMDSKLSSVEKKLGSSG